jgi:hypothetical protein
LLAGLAGKHGASLVGGFQSGSLLTNIDRELMKRWLWNVAAVKRWEADDSSDITMIDIDWWKTPNRYSDQQHESQAATQAASDFKIYEFIGQGRKIHYCGLAHAVIEALQGRAFLTKSFEAISTDVSNEMRGNRPASWWILAVTSLGLVWVGVGMAMVIAYNTPTVGIGCWTLTYLLYGIVSTLPWLVHFVRKHPGGVVRFFCRISNMISTVGLFFIIFAHVSFPADF